MTEPSPVVSFGLLPPEIKANVFAFIRTPKGRATVCLVCKGWRIMMNPSLWARLESTFEETPTRNLTSLLQPGSGILPHIRELSICEPDIEPGRGGHRQEVLKAVIGALPKDSLTEFFSQGELYESTVVQLLQSQRQLTFFDTPIKETADHEPPQLPSIRAAPWLIPSLHHIKVLYICASTCVSTGKDCTFLIKSCPSLKTFSIDFFWCDSSLEFISQMIFESETPAPIGLLNLGKVRFADMHVGVAPNTTFRYIDFSSLTQLYILRCKRAAPFLDALSAFYARAPCRLDCLHVCLSKSRGDENDNLVQAIQSLLNCVSPLKELYVETSTDALVDLSCIFRFSNRLKILWWGSKRVQAISYLGLGDLVQLSQACPLLEQLAIDLCPMSTEALESPGSIFALDQDLYLPQTELLSILDGIARQPSLHTLRVLSISTIGCQSASQDLEDSTPKTDFAREITRDRVQKSASEMMRYLVNRGSKLKLLAFSSRIQLETASLGKDSNGHRWPNYYYLRGRDVDAEGRERIVAIPVMHPKLEMPGSCVINGYEA